MRIAFAGTPAFAATALERLLRAQHDLVLVLTQPDRPSGRGLRLSTAPVKALALEHGLSLLQPPTLRSAAVQAEIARARPDVMVVAAYGLILPQAILDIPPRGCLNIHASLLPRWRGAAPIQRAILAGDRASGITIMQMDPGLDTGPILMQQAVSIDPADTAGTLRDKLAMLGAALIEAALDAAARDALQARAQPSDGVTYADKIQKHEAAVDWSKPADVLARCVRAFDPYPGAYTTLHGETIKLWSATGTAAGPKSGVPGEVVAVTQDAILVACGAGTLSVRELQRAGGKRLAARLLLRGFSISPGTRLGT